MSADGYPVVLKIERPLRLDRVQVVLRAMLIVIASMLIGGFGLVGLLYLAAPVAAAVLVAQKDGRRYLDEDGPEMTRAIEIVVGILAYLMLLTDRLPGSGATRLQIDRSGTPTVGSTLLRLLTAIPNALALALLGAVAGVAWIVAAVSVLVDERYAHGLGDFLEGVLRWQARLLAYLASLVEAYPPFSLSR